jgi:hypothetical protein
MEAGEEGASPGACNPEARVAHRQDLEVREERAFAHAVDPVPEGATPGPLVSMPTTYGGQETSKTQDIAMFSLATGAPDIRFGPPGGAAIMRFRA